MALTVMPVTATFQRQPGVASSGNLQWQLSADLFQAGQPVANRAPLSVTLDSNARFAVLLWAVDDTGVAPTGVFWTLSGIVDGEAFAENYVLSHATPAQTTVAAASNGAVLPQATLNVASTAGFAASGYVAVISSTGAQLVAYTGVTATTFTGCTGGAGTLQTGGAVVGQVDISQLTPASPANPLLPVNAVQLQSYPVSGVAPTTSYVLTWNGAAWAPAAASGGVSSFNTRTGAVTLSKADVTGTGLAAPDVAAVPTAALPSTGTTGAPTAGTWTAGQQAYDSADRTWICTASGTPGTWQQPGTSGLPVDALGNVSGVTALPLASAAGTYFTATLVGNTTLSNPTGANASTLAQITLALTEDGVGGHTVVWPSAFNWVGAVPTMPSGAGASLIVFATSTNGGTSWTAYPSITHGCKAYPSGPVSIPSATYTALSFDTNEFDSDGIHSTSVNNTRFTVPTGLSGIWMFGISAEIAIPSSNYFARLRLNGTTWVQGVSDRRSGIANECLTGTFVVNLNQGDYVEFMIYQDQGSPQNILGVSGAPSTTGWGLYLSTPAVAQTVINNVTGTFTIAQRATITASTALNAANISQPIDTTSGPVIVTLPNATTCKGQSVVAWKVSTDPNPWTLQAFAGQTIGSRGLSALQYWSLGPAVWVYSDGANWQIIDAPDPGVVRFRYYDSGAADSTADMILAVAVAAAIMGTLAAATIEVEANKSYALNTAPVTTGGAYAIVPLTGLPVSSGDFNYVMPALTIQVRDDPSNAANVPTFTTTQSPGYDAIKGQPSIFGGPAAKASVTATTQNAAVCFKNVVFNVPLNPRIACVDGWGLEQINLKGHCHAQPTGYNPAPGGNVHTTAVDGIGFIFPANNGFSSEGDHVSAIGLTAGVIFSEHGHIDYLVAGRNTAGVCLMSASHANHITHYNPEWDQYDIAGYVFGTGVVTLPAPASAQGFQLNIDLHEAEDITTANLTTTATIFDTNGHGSGRINYARVRSGVGVQTGLVGTVGGNGWRIVDINANLTAPSVAATSGLGSGATVSVSGSDKGGTITINTGTGPTSGGVVTLTFGTAYAAAPTGFISPADSGTAAAQPYVTTTTTTMVVTFIGALAGSSTFHLGYRADPAPQYDR